ncbi:hypothetical protein A0H81_12140 [Grifola frondosa]|uniref:Uncharacterized protein n=1 Tax=Grifola frondosa TaxID=5627 RepID=A0A1C7LTP6_GRIFR|nr:hypothetical protein A0H81_12140 [Grifola frondosa]
MTRGRMNARDLVRVEPPRTPRSRSQTPSLSGSDSRSDTSGSTYYVLPSPGQKVQIVVPNSASVYTASSTTKSAHSPRSPHSGVLVRWIREDRVASPPTFSLGVGHRISIDSFLIPTSTRKMLRPFMDCCTTHPPLSVPKPICLLAHSTSHTLRRCFSIQLVIATHQ